MKSPKRKVNLFKNKQSNIKRKTICAFLIGLMCVGLCGCTKNNSTDIDINNSLSATLSSNNDKTTTLPLIETLEFSVNDVVFNSKPEDLYYQICDVYLSPVEGLSVAEFMERAKKSSLQLTYNILEDDIQWIFSDYSDNYLVTGGENVKIFFYCEEQLVFELLAQNLTDKTLPLKDCYAFEIIEMHEYFSKDAADVNSISWYCGGIPFGGDGYTYATIKEAFTNWGLEYEEETNDDGTLTLYSVVNAKINVGFQNESFVNYASYSAVVDKSTGEVVKFFFR